MNRLLLVAAATVGLLVPRLAAGAGAAVAPEFTLSRKDLTAMVALLPKGIRDRILAGPAPFLQQLSRVLDQPAELLLLVDKRHSLAADFAPPDIVLLHKSYGLAVSKTDVPVRELIMPAVREMDRAARAEGITLLFSSGYRSYEYQKSVYAREVKTYGQETADRESARPGMSQHQLGTAIDFGSITDAFADTRAGRWMAAHAWEYGFSLSFPKGYEEITGYRHESWHYRFITKPAVLLQRSYFDDVQQYMLEFLNANRVALEAARRAPR